MHSQRSFSFCQLAALPAVVLAAAISAPSMATPIEHSFTFQNVDWASAGIGGIGRPGSGSLEIEGIEGEVVQAFFYWHGINWRQAEPYNSPFVTFEGEQIEGTLLGDGGTNCWPDEENGVSRAYRADVTHLIHGDGEYSFSGLSHEPGAVRMTMSYNVNGASLIVVFRPEPGQPVRDLVLFDGNDSSHPEGFPGQLPGWNAVLEPIPFQGGEVIAEFHVADGQWFPEEDRGEGVTFSTDQGSLTLPDEGLYWSGRSVPSLWNSRAGDFAQLREERRLRPGLGELWDIHRFDITAAFGSEPGERTLRLEGMTEPRDCKALIALAIGLEAGTAPEAPESTTRVSPAQAPAEVPEPTPAPPEPPPPSPAEPEPEPEREPEPEPLPEWTTDRPILAVAEFTNDATSVGWWGGGIGSELASMLASELAAIDAFVVVERERLDRVLDEQDLAASGRVRPDTAAASGRLVGAQYIVMGTVTDYSENTSRRGGGLNVRGPSIGGRRANIGVGGGQSEAYIAVDVRVVNATTGELVHVRTIEGRTQDSSVSLRGSVGRLGGDLARENDTPAGEAIRAALIEITDYLECEMVLQTAACQARYQERESRRRERTRDALRF